MRDIENRVLGALIARAGLDVDTNEVYADDPTWQQLRLGILRGDEARDVVARFEIDTESPEAGEGVAWMRRRPDAPRLRVVSDPSDAPAPEKNGGGKAT